MKANMLVAEALMILGVCLTVNSCGGSGASNPPPLPSPSPSGISVSISPKSVDNLPAGGTQIFSATVTGTSNQAVTWSVQEGTACGSITTSGTYLAPNSPGLVCHVVATSQADAAKSDMAIVTLSPISMSVLPVQVSLGFGQAQIFNATVQGTPNTAVIWSVQEGAAGGSITAQGVYTAPQVLGTFHVVATSQADSRFSAAAMANVVPIAVTIFPKADTLGPLGARAFTATVTITDQAATWAIQEGPGGGSITNTGVYTAPQSLGTFHVVASSVEDPTKDAIAIVTVVQSGFTGTGSMLEGRQSHTATLLADGRVLVTGGEGEVTADCGCGPTFASAELFDPGSGTFTATGSMTTPRVFHTATLLIGGKVLIAGGSSSTTAEIFDPTSRTFTATGSMAAVRVFHTATLLPNGKVLIAGGSDGGGPLATAELFDPASGTFTATGSMITPREFHSASRLSSGKVLIAGGSDGGGPLATAELFDPASGTFTPTGSMTMPRAGQSATLLAPTLPNGKVLIAGGSDGSGPLATAELFDPANGTFTGTGHLTAPRAGHAAALLLNKMVLITGGPDLDNFGLPGWTAELFDPASGSFTTTGSMATPRIFHTATLLANGKVLVVGGLIDDIDVTAAAELYE